MRTVCQTSQVQQNESELERAPLGLREFLRVSRRSGGASTCRLGDGEVHQLKRSPGVGISAQQFNAFRDTVSSPFHFRDEAIADLVTTRGKAGQFSSFFLDPLDKQRGEVLERGFEPTRSLARECGQGLHPEAHGARQLAIHVGSDSLDFCTGHGVRPDLHHMVVGVLLRTPARSGISSYRPFTHISVMKIGDA